MLETTHASAVETGPAAFPRLPPIEGACAELPFRCAMPFLEAHAFLIFKTRNPLALKGLMATSRRFPEVSRTFAVLPSRDALLISTTSTSTVRLLGVRYAAIGKLRPDVFASTSSLAAFLRAVRLADSVVCRAFLPVSTSAVTAVTAITTTTTFASFPIPVVRRTIAHNSWQIRFKLVPLNVFEPNIEFAKEGTVANEEVVGRPAALFAVDGEPHNRELGAPNLHFGVPAMRTLEKKVRVIGEVARDESKFDIPSTVTTLHGIEVSMRTLRAPILNEPLHFLRAVGRSTESTAGTPHLDTGPAGRGSIPLRRIDSNGQKACVKLRRHITHSAVACLDRTRVVGALAVERGVVVFGRERV